MAERGWGLQAGRLEPQVSLASESWWGPETDLDCSEGSLQGPGRGPGWEQVVGLVTWADTGPCPCLKSLLPAGSQKHL